MKTTEDELCIAYRVLRSLENDEDITAEAYLHFHAAAKEIGLRIADRAAYSS